jgi:hypothetical protein
MPRDQAADQAAVQPKAAIQLAQAQLVKALQVETSQAHSTVVAVAVALEVLAAR